MSVAVSLHDRRSPAALARTGHTVWGLEPAQLHARVWASRGVQVVRQGEPSELVRHAELYLLLDWRMLTSFPLGEAADLLAWTGASLLLVRVHDERERGYREHLIADNEGRLLRFERSYDGIDGRRARVALTPDRELAAIWQGSPDPRTGWRRLREAAGPRDRWVARAQGRVFDRARDRDRADFVRHVVETWARPDATIDGIRRIRKGVWAHEEATVPESARFVGPVWIGGGRELEEGEVIIGPTAVWDDAMRAPMPRDIRWLDLEPAPPPERPDVRRFPPLERAAKRAFDIAFALVALALTLPLYPLVALAILIEDGGPIFFAHRRETLGGREFPCIKFRSMRKNAEEMKRELAAANQADGPQFFIENDPRLTRVGALLRKFQIDELPQFLNVLMGHMSVVGPRPSPRKENQYCPGWREARLSVRPGVTGLWQVSRTRAAGTDFQEWIRYDIEYVERASLWLDVVIIGRTIGMILRGVLKS